MNNKTTSSFVHIIYSLDIYYRLDTQVGSVWTMDGKLGPITLTDLS